MRNEQLVALVIAGLLLVTMLGMFLLMLSLLRPWLQGIMAGAKITVIDLIGMKLRKVDVSQVLKCLILARQSGVEVSNVDLQRAYLRGVDIEKVTMAHIQAQKQQLGTTFEELVELEQQDRLAEKLKL